MKLIMLSTDKNIFKNGSEVRNRMLEYGTLVDELHIVVKSRKSNVKSQNIGNVFLYPTNDKFKFFYFFNVYKITQEIICKLQATSCKLLITCQDPFETGLVGYFLKKKFKVPLHIQIHTDFLSPYFWKESIKNKIKVLIAKRIIQKADGIRVVSERIKSSLQAISCKQKAEVAVLPIFVDIEKIKNAQIKTDLHKKYPGKFIILMASRFTKEKNIGLAIKSLRYLTGKYPDLLLLIVGSGPEHENLKSKISNLKLENNIILEDWSDDLASYYKTSDLFLITSNYEGYCMTAIEAAASGLPVIMTDVGISIGSIVPIGNSNKLIKNLDILIDNSLERETVLENQKTILNNILSKKSYLDLYLYSLEKCLKPIL